MANINKIIQNLKKEFGSAHAALMSDPAFWSNAPYGISTQSLALDLAIGRPGFPGGRIIEIAGLEGHGKSTLGEHLMAEAQRIGGIAALIETEHGRDPMRSKRIGVDLTQLITCQPETLEDGFSMLEECITSIRKVEKTCPVLILWDSIAAIQVKEEEKKDFDEMTMASHAKVISKALRKLVPIIARQQITLVFINQLKANFANRGYGDPWVSFGGKAIAYMASIQIRVKKTISELDPETKQPLGFWAKVVIKKNKLAPPKQAEFFINFLSGIDKNRDLIDTAAKYKLIKEGAPGRFTFNKTKCTKKTWAEVVIKPKGADKVRDMLTLRAIKREVIRGYGEAT